jgi:hypothetical protein
VIRPACVETETAFIHKGRKVNLSLCFFSTEHNAVKAYWGSGGIAPRILMTLALDGGEWSASCPWPLYPLGKSPCYPLNRRTGGTQSPSGRCGEEKNSQLF